MLGSLAFMLLGAAATMPCESLATVKLDKAVITSAEMVAEGPAPRAGGARIPQTPACTPRRGAAE